MHAQDSELWLWGWDIRPQLARRGRRSRRTDWREGSRSRGVMARRNSNRLMDCRGVGFFVKCGLWMVACGLAFARIQAEENNAGNVRSETIGDFIAERIRESAAVAAATPWLKIVGRYENFYSRMDQKEMGGGDWRKRDYCDELECCVNISDVDDYSCRYSPAFVPWIQGRQDYMPRYREIRSRDDLMVLIENRGIDPVSMQASTNLGATISYASEGSVAPVFRDAGLIFLAPFLLSGDVARNPFQAMLMRPGLRIERESSKNHVFRVYGSGRRENAEWKVNGNLVLWPEKGGAFRSLGLEEVMVIHGISRTNRVEGIVEDVIEPVEGYVVPSKAVLRKWRDDKKVQEFRCEIRAASISGQPPEAMGRILSFAPGTHVQDKRHGVEFTIGREGGDLVDAIKKYTED